MVNHCCVPLSHSKSSREKELSFHCFPTCKSKNKKWKAKMHHDEGELFTVTDHKQVCFLYFTAGDYQTTLGECKAIRYKN